MNASALTRCGRGAPPGTGLYASSVKFAFKILSFRVSFAIFAGAVRALSHFRPPFSHFSRHSRYSRSPSASVGCFSTV